MKSQKVQPEVSPLPNSILASREMSSPPGGPKMNPQPAVATLAATTLRDALPRRGSTPIEPRVRRFMEARFGADFGDVRVHTGPAAAALCQAVGARAFTLGRDVIFGAGQYAP